MNRFALNMIVGNAVPSYARPYRHHHRHRNYLPQSFTRCTL